MWIYYLYLDRCSYGSCEGTVPLHLLVREKKMRVRLTSSTLVASEVIAVAVRRVIVYRQLQGRLDWLELRDKHDVPEGSDPSYRLLLVEGQTVVLPGNEHGKVTGNVCLRRDDDGSWGSLTVMAKLVVLQWEYTISASIDERGELDITVKMDPNDQEGLELPWRPTTPRKLS